MTRRVDITPAAESDLDAEFDYLADRNADAARRFYKAAHETFAQLAEMPGTGTSYPSPPPKLAGMRRRLISGFRNYLAFYLTTDDSIQVLRVLHGAMDIEAVFNKGDAE